MGQRANVVIIQEGIAKAYFDNWGALAVLPWFTLGPVEASSEFIEDFEETDELLDWEWAEGGGIIDFDKKYALMWGIIGGEYGMAFETEKTILNKYTKNYEDEDEDWDEEYCEEFTTSFLCSIKPAWIGWELCYADLGGVDAISVYLKEQGFTNISGNPDASPEALSTATVLARDTTPEEDSQILKLSDSTVKQISQYEGDLELSMVTCISDTAAEFLAQHKGGFLELGLAQLSENVAKALSKHQGNLILGGLTELSDAAAESLLKYKGKINDMNPKKWIESLKNNE